MPKKLEKLTREDKLELMFDLINSFTIVKKPVETALFLQDLLSANEIKNLAKRLRIAKLLLSGLTQREVADEADVSVTTVNKVGLWLNRSGEGFKNVIGKLPQKWAIPDKLPPGPIEYHLPQAIMKLTQYYVATKQEKAVHKFIKSLKDKEILDRGIRKETNEYYRLKSLENLSFGTMI